MKLIPVKYSKLKTFIYALVSDEDYYRVSKHNWSVLCSNLGRIYARTSIKGKTVLMHRFIMEVHNMPKEVIVDHLSKNKLDNTRDNLRVCSQSQNLASANKLNKDGYIGCGFHKATGKFRAYINIGGKQKHIGLYFCLDSAAMAYDNEAKKIFKQYAVLNFPF